MQRVPADLDLFIQQKLNRFASNENAVVELCCNYLRQSQFESTADIAKAAATLFVKLDAWGHYPTKFVACCLSWKFKTCFEELSDVSQTESILKILARVLEELPHPNIARLYFGLILAQKVHNLGDKEVVKAVVNCCLSNLRRHQELDRLINLILIKFTLKVSEHIRDLKWSIAAQSMRFVLSVASRSYLTPVEPHLTLKPLMEYLKLLVALGREIASGNSDDKGDIDESHLRLLRSLVKTLILNLTLTPANTEDATSYYIYHNVHPDYLQEIFKDPLLEELSQEVQSKKYWGLEANSYLQPAFPLLEQEVELTHATEQPSDAELIEKIKINSIKLLMVVARNRPEIFDLSPIHDMIFPSGLKSLDTKQIYQNTYFFPAKLFNAAFSESLQFLYGDSVVSLTGLQAKYQRQGKAASAYCSEVRAHLRSVVGAPEIWSKGSSVSLLGCMLNEAKSEIKTLLMECLGVIHLNLYKKSSSGESGNLESKNNLPKANYSLVSLREWGITILTAYFVELYTCKPVQFSHILEGIASCQSESIFMHVPNKMVDKILEYFVIPVLATCVHSDFEFLPQFEKFLEAIFEAGFSEYFLPKINTTKLILETVISFCSMQPQDSELPESTTKLKVLLLLVDQLFLKCPFEMIDLLPLITGFLEHKVLKDNKYASLHPYAPQILDRICSAERNFPAERRKRQPAGIYAADDWECTLISRLRRQKSSIRRLEGLSAVQELIPDSYSTRLLVWKNVIDLYAEVVRYATQTSLKEKFERNLVSAFLMLDPTELRFMEPYLVQKHNLTVNQFMAKLMQELKNQKNRLLVVEHILSCKLELSPGLRKKMWTNLFAMYKDKVLSVEIVFTNYNIIYGLRHFPELIPDNYLKEIMSHTMNSLRSKNRKLLNNCLKIFGYILGFYSFGILNWIVEAEVPNVFYEEMQGEGELAPPTLPGIHFIRLLFRKFNSHKYSKYNVVAVSSATIIVKRHELIMHPRSIMIVDTLVKDLSSILIDKLAATESYKYHSLACTFLGREAVLKVLSLDQLQILATIGLAKIIKTNDVEVNTLSSEYYYWEELKVKGFAYFLQIHSHLIKRAEEIGKITSDTYSWLLGKERHLVHWVKGLVTSYGLESIPAGAPTQPCKTGRSMKSDTEFWERKFRINSRQTDSVRKQLKEFLTDFIGWASRLSGTLSKTADDQQGASAPKPELLGYKQAPLHQVRTISLVLAELSPLSAALEDKPEASVSSGALIQC